MKIPSEDHEIIDLYIRSCIKVTNDNVGTVVPTREIHFSLLEELNSPSGNRLTIFTHPLDAVPVMVGREKGEGKIEFELLNPKQMMGRFRNR